MPKGERPKYQACVEPATAGGWEAVGASWQTSKDVLSVRVTRPVGSFMLVLNRPEAKKRTAEHSAAHIRHTSLLATRNSCGLESECTERSFNEQPALMATADQLARKRDHLPRNVASTFAAGGSDPGRLPMALRFEQSPTPL